MTDSKQNVVYSSIKSIYLGDVDIVAYNSECRYERIEMIESISEALPVGSLLVTDTRDIVSFIHENDINTLSIVFLDGSSYICDITSVSYITNASSDNETNSVAINFTNGYYKYFSTNSLNSLLGYQKPTVFSVNEFVTELKGLFGTDSGFNDQTTNFFLYKPLSPYNSGEESIPDNAIEMLNYLANGAVNVDGNPYFSFWTNFDGSVNFKSFERNVLADPNSGDPVNVAVYDGDFPTRDLEGTSYRKIYSLATNPAYQWISKNYYYIRKTPKYLDELPPLNIPAGLTGASYDDAKAAETLKQTNKATSNLSFHFQDDGQKYNIDTITIDGRGTDIPQGGDNIFYDYSWGYFDDQTPSNNKSITSLIGQNIGTQKNYNDLLLMGQSGYMPFIDSPDMWKNMFDLTPIHPNYPDNTDDALTTSGSGTNLQKVMDIRYDAFKSTIDETSSERLTKLREIEAQNFVLHSLCCMGKEDCFFAALQRYEQDASTYGSTGGTGGNCAGAGITFTAGAKYYRYKWNKINFEGNTYTSGNCGASSGSTYAVTRMEKWSLDPVIKSSDTQDKTWAINLNERGLTGSYLPPGWAPPASPNIKFRPIGATGPSLLPYADIFHIARICLHQVDANNKIAYFIVENVVDGAC